MNDMGLVLNLQGKTREAEDLYRQVMQTKEKLQGKSILIL
jgi:hypothetical protein